MRFYFVFLFFYFKLKMFNLKLHLKKKPHKFQVFKKIKFIYIFIKFNKIIKFFNNLITKNFNFKNIFNKINLKYFFSIKQFFLRKTKCFNKSRYSRNRQNFRTGFY